jgi:hypothetical protein
MFKNYIKTTLRTIAKHRADSVVNIAGLASLLTEKRTKEVGIRKVMGASAPGLLALLSGRFFATVLAANVIALGSVDAQVLRTARVNPADCLRYE